MAQVRQRNEMDLKKPTACPGGGGILRINKISVLLRNGTDLIDFDLDVPTTFPVMKYEPHATMEAQKGCGVQWVRDHFGVEPIIYGS